MLDVGCGPGYFTIAMAELVGPTGVVIAADIQEKMLQSLEKRALEAGVISRIRTHLSTRDRMGVPGPVDFVLAIWMAHEVNDKAAFFAEVRECMKPDATLLLAEPKWHVKGKEFTAIVNAGEKTGLRVLRPERIPMSHAVLFGRG